MEWDTAAGQAVVKYAGGNVLQYQSQESLKYNKQNLYNPWFISQRRRIKNERKNNRYK